MFCFLQVPATREVLASLPNVFSALCLNTRGLEAFVQCKPFDRLFKVLLSQDYLPAMRKRRSSDPLGKILQYYLQTMGNESIVVSPYHLCDVMIVLNSARINCCDLASLDTLDVNQFVLVLLQHYIVHVLNLDCSIKIIGWVGWKMCSFPSYNSPPHNKSQWNLFGNSPHNFNSSAHKF